MGSCSIRHDKSDSTISLSRTQFTFDCVIGKGGFGRVWKVEFKRTHETFALKEMAKSRIISKRSVGSVMNERKLLVAVRHPFIVNMQFAFQDRDNLYLAMDYMSGGDLRYHLSCHKRFSEDVSKFFIACIVVGLEHLHLNSIIHRDIKPENLVLDSLGYVRITDFGVARVVKPVNAQDTSGTPGYMAPEVLCRQNHGTVADYFAVGVIAHEFMIGRRPYIGRSRAEIKDAVLARQVKLQDEDIPEGWTTEAADFVNSLIQRKPSSRLGINGPSEVKRHPWFKGFDWEALLEKSIVPRHIPNEDQNFDKNQVVSAWKDAATIGVCDAEAQNLFTGYFYDPRLLSKEAED
jgi:serine/threonine protein kinase